MKQPVYCGLNLKRFRVGIWRGLCYVRLLCYAVSATMAIKRRPLVAFYDTLGIRRTYSRLKPPASSRGLTWIPGKCPRCVWCARTPIRCHERLHNLHKASELIKFVAFLLRWLVVCASFPCTVTPWGRRGRIRPQHPLACRKRRLNGAACLPWAATRVAWGKDPGGWGLELTVLSSGSNTPLWPLLVLDGRLNLARFNQSAGRAEPRDECLSIVI